VEIATSEVSRVLGLIAVVEGPSHDRKVANYRQRRDALFWFVSFTVQGHEVGHPSEFGELQTNEIKFR